MRIGDTVVRVKEEHNLRKVGDIAVVDGLKIYNKGVCVHLEGDKPDTWNSESNYRNIEDVDMPCLEAKLAIVREKLLEHTAKARSGKKIFQNQQNDNPDEPEDDLIHDLADTEGSFDQTEFE